MDVSLETPRFLLEAPMLFFGDPIFSLETPIFLWRPPDFHWSPFPHVVIEDPQSPIKIWRYSMKI